MTDIIYYIITLYNYRVKNDSIKVYQLKSNLLMMYNVYNVDVHNVRFIIGILILIIV